MVRRTLRPGRALAALAIDVTFDFRSDTPSGLDPDTHSRTLRSYHKLLWSKALPSGERFELSDATSGSYLHHESALGTFHLASDAVMQTFTRWIALKPITDQLGDAANDEFVAIGYTMGGMMLFPGNRIGRQITINVARGFNRSISDRMDLTLECIRRHYLGEPSPLAKVLDRYADFFALFRDFDGYVDFWLLHDLVDADRVRFFMPFDNFATAAVPKDLDTYVGFRRRSIEFIHARNSRIFGLGL